MRVLLNGDKGLRIHAAPRRRIIPLERAGMSRAASLEFQLGPALESGREETGIVVRACACRELRPRGDLPQYLQCLLPILQS